MVKLHTPNFEIGRAGHFPEAIVIHTSEGSQASTISWIMNPKSQVSYHYLIGQDGKIYELVNPDNTAWHAGKAQNSTWELLKKGINPNLYTLGIAFAGMAKDGPTFWQMIQGIYLIRELAFKYNITLDEKHVIPHNMIRTDKTCPGARVSAPAMALIAGLS